MKRQEVTLRLTKKMDVAPRQPIIGWLAHSPSNTRNHAPNTLRSPQFLTQVTKKTSVPKLFPIRVPVLKELRPRCVHYRKEGNKVLKRNGVSL